MRIAFAIAATAVVCGIVINHEEAIIRATLEAARTPGIMAVPRSQLREQIIVAPDLRRLDRDYIMRRLFAVITAGVDGDRQIVTRVAAWVQEYFVHPLYAPLRPDGQGVYDPVQLLRLRRAQCGQVNRVLIDILAAGGYRGRIVQLTAHQGAEVYYGGSWHYVEADLLSDGQQITDDDGTLPSAKMIHDNPSIADHYCMSCETLIAHRYITPDTIFSQRIQAFLSGARWRDVFSAPPYYYEKERGADDPEYGWNQYRTLY